MNTDKKTKNEVMITKLIDYINDYAGIDIRDKCRDSRHVFSRTVYFRIEEEYIPDTLFNVASSVNRNHATAIYARKMFKEIENYSVYSNIYNDACAYIDFIDGMALEEYNTMVESQKASLAEQIAKLNDVIMNNPTISDPGIDSKVPLSATPTATGDAYDFTSLCTLRSG